MLVFVTLVVFYLRIFKIPTFIKFVLDEQKNCVNTVQETSKNNSLLYEIYLISYVKLANTLHNTFLNLFCTSPLP
jgi:hypothetical protein